MVNRSATASYPIGIDRLEKSHAEWNKYFSRLSGFTCTGGFVGIQCIRIHAVQVMSNLWTEASNVVLKYEARFVWKLLLNGVHQLNLFESTPSSSGERVEGFGEQNFPSIPALPLRSSWSVFLSYEVVCHEA